MKDGNNMVMLTTTTTYDDNNDPARRTARSGRKWPSPESRLHLQANKNAIETARRVSHNVNDLSEDPPDNSYGQMKLQEKEASVPCPSP